MKYVWYFIYGEWWIYKREEWRGGEVTSEKREDVTREKRGEMNMLQERS